MPHATFEPSAYISVSSRCNNDCVFCGLKEYGIDYVVPPQEIQEQLAVFYENGMRRIVFTGGEPTIHPQILDIVNAARSMGFTSVSLFTNARRFKSPGLAQAFKDAGLDSVMASLHGRTAETHDAGVRSKGAFEQTVQGLHALANSGIRLVVNTPVTEINLAEITSMYDLIAGLNGRVSRWQLSNIFPTAVVMNNPGLQPDYALVREIIYRIMERAVGGELRCVTQEFPLCIVFPWLNETRDLSDQRTQMICRRDLKGDYRRYRPWSSPYKTKLPSCAPCGMREVCGGVSLCYLMSHRDLSIFRPLEHLTPESWRRQMGVAD
jgi:MoaA/NifB/PqqE/SkfB family radical SAM enzyme